MHFYIVSILSLGFWMNEILTQGATFRLICNMCEHQNLNTGMSIEQIALTWSLMFAHSIRRLFESFFLTKPSTSKMWFVHWLMGIAFYLITGIAIWVEGAGEFGGKYLEDYQWLSMLFLRHSLCCRISACQSQIYSAIAQDARQYPNIHPGIWSPTRLSCVSCNATEIYITTASNFSLLDMSSLLHGMFNLFVIIPHFCTKGCNIE